MKQLTLATVGFERYAKMTRRAAFLAEMERVVPWLALCGRIEPVYPKPGNGRPPVPDETTVCRFRHLLEAHDLGRRLFDEVQRHLAAKGLKVATGTIVDAT